MTTPIQHRTTRRDNPGQEPRKRFETLRILAVVTFPVILAVVIQRVSIEQPLRPGDAAPELFLQSLTGESISLPQLYSQRLAVLFFSVDCSHCRRELGNIKSLREIFNGSIQFLLITTTDGARTKSLLDSLGINIPIVVDDRRNTQSAFGVFTVPALFLIRSNGIVHASSFGERPLNARREQLESFLQASADEARTLGHSPR